MDTLGPDQAVFCRITQMGTLRLLTNPRVMGDDVLTAHRAWQVYERMRGDERVSFAGEPASLEDGWKRVSQENRPAPNLWIDSYLLALARAGDHQVITFDRAFQQRDRSRVKLLA